MAERTVFQSLSQKHVLSVPPQGTVREAACAMARAGVGSILVMEPPDKLLGILTERDLMNRVLAKSVDPDTTSVRAVMTPNPICVPPETTVANAVVIMIERGFRHIPIVAPGNRILGVFSVRDALPREVSAALSQTEFNEQVNDALG
ncbi:MAG TPA: CBS domain-containing protein [Ramlibacter sp.]|uniref:CBS domain-containing protein n=1 Tax=Ramlibacter sp. TaxID=1917967 RepID=UPI002C00B8E9|nr:CBS domain-containing protein [Ramlibacter sp.]HVZ43507.1 CBS domain-containing protein [Ramlibacter sp.]